ncbi:hypothetical protein LVJ94_26140 [Pendulispora rubella]|uniref:Uncharacterized protein n=1 Tax=Pendulispora rubella TaxID=2741070 RepID=A0ABZ2KTT7_9BACT
MPQTIRCAFPNVDEEEFSLLLDRWLSNQEIDVVERFSVSMSEYVPVVRRALSSASECFMWSAEIDVFDAPPVIKLLQKVDNFGRWDWRTFRGLSAMTGGLAVAMENYSIHSDEGAGAFYAGRTLELFGGDAHHRLLVKRSPYQKIGDFDGGTCQLWFFDRFRDIVGEEWDYVASSVGLNVLTVARNNQTRVTRNAARSFMEERPLAQAVFSLGKMSIEEAHRHFRARVSELRASQKLDQQCLEDAATWRWRLLDLGHKVCAILQREGPLDIEFLTAIASEMKSEGIAMALSPNEEPFQWVHFHEEGSVTQGRSLGAKAFFEHLNRILKCARFEDCSPPDFEYISYPATACGLLRWPPGESGEALW